MLEAVPEVIDARIAVARGDAKSIDVVRMFELAEQLNAANMPAWADEAIACAEIACLAAVET